MPVADGQSDAEWQNVASERALATATTRRCCDISGDVSRQDIERMVDR